uniref:HEAT repeat-containing protein 1 n=1 Tax=Macrostomum lignano TaxID=282301 RepID=A0A1I8FBU5_9PLAT
DEAQISRTLVPAYISWLKDSASEIPRLGRASPWYRVVKDHKSLTDGIAKSASLAALATEATISLEKCGSLARRGTDGQRVAASCIPVLVPQLMKLSSDKVPTIIKKDIISPLVELSKDEDADVRFYAEEAVSSELS